MTERLEEIAGRLANIREIGEIVGALRVIATAHQGEARTALTAVRAYSETVGAALARALAAEGAHPARGLGPGLAVVIGAAQGFSGAYSDRLAHAATEAQAAGDRLVVLGGRTQSALAAAGVPVAWAADMPVHPAAVPGMASTLADAILDNLGPPGPVRLIAADPDTPGQPVTERPVFPPETPTTPVAPPGLTTLPGTELLAALLPETLFAALCRALLEGIAAENTARAEAMANAMTSIKRQTAAMTVAWQQARQERATDELIELVSAGDALRRQQ